MKRINKFLALCLVLIICFASCQNVSEQSESSTSSSSLEDESKAESSNSSSEESAKTSESESQNPTDSKKQGVTEVRQTQKYYRELSSDYSRTTVNSDGEVGYGQIFLDGVFELKQESQYKVVSSHSELQVFALLNHEEAESDLFDNNYVVAILHYFEGPTGGGRLLTGFYNADFNNADEAEITGDFISPYMLTTDDMGERYELYFIVVPKTEIEEAEQICSISVNINDLEQYSLSERNIENATEVTAYYIQDAQAKESLEIPDTISKLCTSYPCIAIHLDKVIETNYIVNGFKYENGEIYITVQIFEKTETDPLYEPANLFVVSLTPHYAGLEINVPDNVPSDCAVNIVLEYVVSKN